MIWALRALLLVVGAGFLGLLTSWEVSRARRNAALADGGPHGLPGSEAYLHPDMNPDMNPEGHAALNPASLDTQPVNEPGDSGPGPFVDWPPESDRTIVALRLVSVGPSRLSGYAIRQALESEGFMLGKYSIFHKGEEAGRAYISAASLTQPGAFDLSQMDQERFGGLSLFAVLPGPKSPLDTFDDLLTTARGLNDRLQGALQDEHGLPLTPLRVSNLRRNLQMEPPAA